MKPRLYLAPRLVLLGGPMYTGAPAPPGARRPGSRERSPRPEDLVFPPAYERDALDAGPHSGLRQDRWPPARHEGEHRLPGAGEYRRRTGPGRRRWGRCYTEWSFKLDGIAGPFAPGPR